MIGSSITFAERLLRWYDVSRRDLPWRVDPSKGQSETPDPYHVMISEAMLQQTQVATVIPYFHRFLERFPTLASLADADEQDVLRLWQGLGYYSRARNLLAAARMTRDQLGGQLPTTVEQLLKLPGVGRYTAGAIASIAFETKAPIVDGNVARVLCRVDKIESDPRDKATLDLLWTRAEQILPGERFGDFNSSLMELGATVCTPRSPQCLICPVREHCEARAAGLQETIPAPKKTKVNPLEQRWTFIVQHGQHFLIEQRPPSGRWAGMWQFVTLPAADGVNPRAALESAVGATLDEAQPKGIVTHALTHRRYEFTVFAAVASDRFPSGPRTWATLGELDRLPLSKPQLKVAAMAHQMVE
ncbi:MAG TPA: A/G-specific adenine glycosylase [Tepidisphaeraceae bacterium]|jgi:A/G-specific adenine glycosylase|nr:A/G-specific adenine glycosylase [Tepidisphaeraceae bacterium]